MPPVFMDSVIWLLDYPNITQLDAAIQPCRVYWGITSLLDGVKHNNTYFFPTFSILFLIGIHSI